QSHSARDRGAINDHATAVHEHLPDLIFHAEKDGAQVRINDVLKDLDIQIPERRKAAVDPRVVVGEVKATEGRDGFMDERLRSGGGSKKIQGGRGPPPHTGGVL